MNAQRLSLKPFCAPHTQQIPKIVLSQRSRLQCRSVSAAAGSVLAKIKLEPAVAQKVQDKCSNVSAEQLQANIEELMSTYRLEDIQKLLSSSPQALSLPISDWKGFFEGYGLGKEALWKALRYSCDELACGDVYTAGAAIRWLKQLGPWSDADIAQRLIPCYPEVLSTPTESLQSLADTLSGLGMEAADVQRMLWEFPGLLAEFRAEQLPLVVRMVESRRDKYSQGATYID